MDNLRREFRVWIKGMALNIPLVNLVTFWGNYQQVLKSQPTGYDLGIANVKSFSCSGLRRAAAMLLTACPARRYLILNVAERTVQAQLQATTRWTNPVTNVVATIPGGWQYQLVQGPEGTPLYGFTDVNTGVVALVAPEEGNGITITNYTQRLRAALTGNTAMGEWTQSDVSTMKSSGTELQDKWPTTIYLTQAGTKFWRIVYIDQLNLVPHEIVEPAMTSALFATVR